MDKNKRDLGKMQEWEELEEKILSGKSPERRDWGEEYAVILG